MRSRTTPPTSSSACGCSGPAGWFLIDMQISTLARVWGSGVRGAGAPVRPLDLAGEVTEPALSRRLRHVSQRVLPPHEALDCLLLLWRRGSVEGDPQDSHLAGLAPVTKEGQLPLGDVDRRQEGPAHEENSDSG